MANEKRLIDANAFIKECDSFIVNPPFAHPATPWYRGLTLAAETALRMPTVDAVEVPCRCKECKYWRHYDHLGCTEFAKVCTLAYYMIGENGYCLYGAKMDGGNEDV